MHKRETTNKSTNTTYPSRPLSVASLSSVSTSFECTANAKSEYVLHIKVLITITAALLPLRPQAQHRRVSSAVNNVLSKLRKHVVGLPSKLPRPSTSHTGGEQSSLDSRELCVVCRMQCASLDYLRRAQNSSHLTRPPSRGLGYSETCNKHKRASPKRFSTRVLGRSCRCHLQCM